MKQFLSIVLLVGAVAVSGLAQSAKREVLVTDAQVDPHPQGFVLSVTGLCFGELNDQIMIHKVGDCVAEFARIPCTNGKFETRLIFPEASTAREVALSYYERSANGYDNICLKEEVLKLGP